MYVTSLTLPPEGFKSFAIFQLLWVILHWLNISPPCAISVQSLLPVCKHQDKKTLHKTPVRPVPQAKDCLLCQPLGSFIGKAAQICATAGLPWLGSKCYSQAKNLMGCFRQHWASEICKSWQQKSSHFTAVLHSQKLAGFGPLLYTPDLFKPMSHDQE